MSSSVVARHLDSLIRGLRRQDSRFADGLLACRGHIIRSVDKIQLSTLDDHVDILHDMLEKLTKTYKKKDLVVYKFKDTNWTIAERDGDLLLLETLPYQTRTKKQLWVHSHTARLKKVPRLTFHSELMRDTTQYMCDRINQQFVSRNGYKVETCEKTIVNRRTKKVEKRKLNEVTQLVKTISLDDRVSPQADAQQYRDIIPDTTIPSPFSFASYKNAYSKMSGTSQSIFAEMMKDPVATAPQLARSTGIPVSCVRSSRREISQVLRGDTFYTPVVSLQPVYFSEAL